MTPRLTKAAVTIINQQIDDLFDSLKVRLLGPQTVDRKLYIGFLRDHSIPGIFEQATMEEGGHPDLELLDRLISVTSDYIDQHKSAAKAAAKKTVQDFLHDVDTGKLPITDLMPTVESSLNDLFSKVTSGVMRVVVTETQHAQTLGIKEGIDHINAQMGIEDPVVCFIPVRDNLLCEECKRLHFFRDTNGTFVPRAWKSSEVKAGYHSKGDPQPSWSLLHPHCRCALTTIMPGFGFDASGRLAWKGYDHNEYDRQHGIEERYESRYGKKRV